MREWIMMGIAIAIVFVWTISTLIAVFTPDHVVPMYVNLAMMSVAGFFFGGSVISRKIKESNGSV